MRKHCFPRFPTPATCTFWGRWPALRLSASSFHVVKSSVAPVSTQGESEKNRCWIQDGSGSLINHRPLHPPRMRRAANDPVSRAIAIIRAGQISLAKFSHRGTHHLLAYIQPPPPPPSLTNDMFAFNLRASDFLIFLTRVPLRIAHTTRVHIFTVTPPFPMCRKRAI